MKPKALLENCPMGSRFASIVPLLGLVLLWSAAVPPGTFAQDRAVRYPSQKPAVLTGEIGSGDLYAVVVGVSKYSNPRIKSLNLSDRDARDFAAFLKTQNNLFRKVHLTLLVNEQATQKEVKKQLFYELRRAGKNDTVILFFAGHGAEDYKMPGEFFFLTHDADPENLEGTAVNLGRTQFMQTLESKRIVVIADACHAGGFSTEGVRSIGVSMHKLMKQFEGFEGRVFLSSCRPDQISREDPQLRNGVFTYYFLEGLRGKADRNGDGVVTLQEAYEYVYNMAKDFTKGGQHAEMKGQVVGSFPIAVVGTAKAETSLKDSSGPEPRYPILGSW